MSTICPEALCVCGSLWKGNRILFTTKYFIAPLPPSLPPDTHLLDDDDGGHRCSMVKWTRTGKKKQNLPQEKTRNRNVLIYNVKLIIIYGWS